MHSHLRRVERDIIQGKRTLAGDLCHRMSQTQGRAEIFEGKDFEAVNFETVNFIFTLLNIMMEQPDETK